MHYNPGRFIPPGDIDMARPRNLLPKLLCHRPSGQAYVYVRTDDGKRKPKYLGPWGSKEAQDGYVAHCAALDARKPVAPDTDPPEKVAPQAPLPTRAKVLTVRDVVAAH